MNEPTRAQWRADEAGDREEFRIGVDPARPIRLAIHNPNGEVTVRVVDRADALILHERNGGAGAAGFADAGLTIAADDNEIEVRVDIPGMGLRKRVEMDLDLDLGGFNPFTGGFASAQGAPGRAFAEAGKALGQQVGRAFAGAWSDVSFDVAVELPSAATESQVSVYTASGDVAVEGVVGAVTASTASGDVHVAALRGELTFQTASGDLRAEGIAGRLTARSASGDVRLSGAALDGFACQSASGDVTIEGSLAGSGVSRAQTVSGDVRLALAAPDGGASDATITLKTVSGDASVAAPFRKTERRTWQAGDGAHRIAVQTVSGDLDVRRAATSAPSVGGGAAARPAAAVPAAVPTVPPPVDARPGPPPIIAVPPPPASTAPPPPDAPPPPEPPTPPIDALAAATGADAAETGQMRDTPAREDDPPPVPATGRPDDARRLEVLAAVERGEIDVEEALRRLDAAEPGAGP